jgi:hypothetical protein
MVEENPTYKMDEENPTYAGLFDSGKWFWLSIISPIVQVTMAQ